MARVIAVEGGIEVVLAGGGEPIVAEQLLVATGRRPNSDLLGLAAAGVDVDARGQIRIDERLHTAAEGVWASATSRGRCRSSTSRCARRGS